MTGTLDLNGELGVVEQDGKWYLARRGDIHQNNETLNWVLSDTPFGQIAQHGMAQKGEFAPLSSFSFQGQVTTDSESWTILYGNNSKVIFDPSIYDLDNIGDIYYQLTGSVDNTDDGEILSVRLTHATDALIEANLSGGAIIDSSQVVQSDDPRHDQQHGVEIQIEASVTGGIGYFRGGVVTVYGEVV